MAIRYPITLSTTEPNNDVGLLKIRQADEQTQTLVVDITANGQPKSYENLQPFFCAKLGQSIGLGIIEQKLETAEMTSPQNGQLEYTFRAEDWQQIGRQVGYFSFRKMHGMQYVEQFTTRDFYFEVTKNVFSEGIKEIHTDGSTHIWTLEDLLRLFNEFINLSENQMLDLEDQWQKFVDQNREILESVDPGGTILKELIDSRDGFDSLGNRLDNVVYDYRADDDLIGIPQPFFQSEIDEIAKKIDTAVFNIGFLTDLHYDYGDGVGWYSSYKMLRHITNMQDIDHLLDVSLYNGDNINGYMTDTPSLKKQYSEFCNRALISASNDVFINLGNHDDGAIGFRSLSMTYRPQDIISTAEFKEMHRTAEKLFEESRDGDSLYFYKDYPEKNIRLIGIDCMDVPEIVNSDGTLKYGKQGPFGFRQEQFDWLVSDALNVDENMHVVITTHAPLNSEASTYDDGWVEEHFNFEQMVSLLQAFQSGEKITLIGTVEDFEINVTADFSAQGVRTLVGVFCGHSHRETIDDKGTFKVVRCLNSRYSDPATVDTLLEDAWTVIAVDTANRHVDLIGFGRATNRSIDY